MASEPRKFGQWEMERILGKGAFGMVTLWRDGVSKERIAIKKLNIQGRNDNWKTEVRFIQEAHHPNIVAYKKIPDDLKQEFPANNSLGMEYCTRGDLRKFLAQSDFCCGLPESLVRHTLADVSSAICYLHEKNSMHRDLKPENIVLQQLHPDDRIQFKITDLGYAKDLNEYSCGKSFVGTQFYLAPEIAAQPRDQLNYRESVDYWSFGLLSFECITGFRPFCPNFEQLAINYIMKKSNEDISIIVEKDPNSPGKINKVHSYQSIPEPNNLNSLFAKDLTIWLQSMLHSDSATRGGGSYQKWSSQLNDFLSKKYIEVVDTVTMNTITFMIKERQTLIGVLNQLSELKHIAVSELLLLKLNGDQPDVEGTIGLQLSCKNENVYQVFLFHSTQKANELRKVSVNLPDNLKKVHDGKYTRVYGNEKQYLAFAYDFVLKRYSWCKTILSVTQSLTLHIIKQGQNLQEQLLRNLETNLRKLEIIKEDKQRTYHRHVDDYVNLQDQHGFEDDSLENLMRAANVELERVDEIISQLNKHVKGVRDKVYKCTADVNNTKTYLKECRKWDIDGIKLEFEQKRRELKETKNKVVPVESFIKKRAVVVNQDANRFINDLQIHIVNLCQCHIEIIAKSELITKLLPDIQEALEFPEQEALRHGIWRTLKPLAKVQNNINGYNRDQSFDTIREFGQDVTNLLSVQFPSLPDLDDELITL